MEEGNTNINTTNSASSDEHNLSKAERRKLKKQEFREQQKAENQSVSKKKFLKNVLYLAVAAAVIIGTFLFFRNVTKEVIPGVDDDPSFGVTGAAITVIECGYFKCTYSRILQNVAFKALKEKYSDRIKWVFRDMPTGQHEFSNEAAEAAQCANEQGKFWEYHSLIFERGAGDQSSLRAYARELALDIKSFDECIKSNRYVKEINNDYRAGKKGGVKITPTFFVNGIKLQGDIPLQTFEQIIEGELKRLS